MLHCFVLKSSLVKKIYGLIQETTRLTFTVACLRPSFWAEVLREIQSKRKHESERKKERKKEKRWKGKQVSEV